MKKILLLIFAITSVGLLSISAQPVTWIFDGRVTSAQSTPTNVAAGNATFGSGLGATGFPTGNAPTATDAYAADGWTTDAALDASDYLEFCITNNTGASFDVTAFKFDERRSGLGPRILEVRSSTDDFATFSTVGTNSFPDNNDFRTQSFTTNITVDNGVMLCFRIYGFNAETEEGTWRFDNVEISGTAPLPIELTYFNANVTANNQVALAWGTASEENNDYMAVERSQDGQKFFEIGKVKGAGTTLEAQVYSFVDAAPKAGVNYYRLRQVDFDGAMEYHKIVAVTVKGAAGVTVYPTLVDATLNVVLEGTATISVMSITGEVVKQVKAADFTTLNVADLAAGTYFLMIENDNTVETVRFVKQ